MTLTDNLIVIRCVNHAAKHGQDALDIINKEGDKIDLILMDLNMPEMDGYETTKLIKLGNWTR